MKYIRYEGNRLRAVRFPLGGIGAGSISLDGSARMVDWEIANRPNKLSSNGWSHIAVKAERDGQVLGTRVLNGPLAPPFTGDETNMHNGYGFGPPRTTLAGVPHFDDVVMDAAFPSARWRFTGNFPAKAALRAFSPFEPINDFDSSLPLAMFEVELENTQDTPIEYTVAFSLTNPFDKKPRNYAVHENTTHGLLCTTDEFDTQDGRYGEVCVLTDCDMQNVQQNWFRGTWFDALGVFWRDFTAQGYLKERNLPLADTAELDTGTVCAHVTCDAGKCVKVRFALAWYYPNCEKYWQEEKLDLPRPLQTWKNWYATQFDGSKQIAQYALKHWARLSQAAEAFAGALFGSSLPPEIIDAASATLAVLKSPTCLRLTDGSFYGWEGVRTRTGSCEGSCTHVWNYQYALPYLFPRLQRSMEELNYRYNMRQDGSLSFRLQLPLGAPPLPYRACADGQLGGIVLMYREWILSGDTKWLSTLWPDIKKSLEYAWSTDSIDLWDPEKTGVLQGRQHHTLDNELFGPSAWLTGYYLAALEASRRMAQAMQDTEFAQQCKEILERGKQWVDKNLWNGNYFIQNIDVTDRSILERFAALDKAGNPYDDVLGKYWNEEHGEIKYQVAQGLSIDQLVGQWHADLCGLGDLFEPAKVRTALGSLMKYNFVPCFGEVFNPCRLYGLQDESGLVICTYPHGVQKPAIPVPYAEESMHGFEYAAACHMLVRGMKEEALRCVRAVRARYDGERRNPWNEMECGSNYARSMAAWSLVNVWLGFSADMTSESIAFNPIEDAANGIWSVCSAWGEVAITKEKAVLTVLGGNISLRQITVPKLTHNSVTTLCAADGESQACPKHYIADGALCFSQKLVLIQGQSIEIQF